MGVIKLLNARLSGGGGGATPEQMVLELVRDMDTRCPVKNIPI